MDNNAKNAPKIRRVEDLQKRIEAIVTEVETGYNSPEMNLVRQKLIEAEHWADEYIGVLSDE